MKEQSAKLDQRVEELDAAHRDHLARIPNVPHESVSKGASAADNAIVYEVCEKRAFDFTPQPHWDLGPALGILDFERALINFMLHVHTRDHGYTEVLPPFMINSVSLYGTGQLPKFAEDLFKLEGTDYGLAPTAEVPARGGGGTDSGLLPGLLLVTRVVTQPGLDYRL